MGEEQALSSEQRDMLLQKRKKEFISKGGTLGEINGFSANLVQTWNQVTYVEYVELRNGKIKVTEGKAGHTLLADGNAVLAAGQIVVLKDKYGTPILLIISNASGNYKPDMHNTSILAYKIAKKLKLSNNQLITTKAEPFSTQIARLQLKDSFNEDPLAKQTLASVSQELNSFFKYQSVLICKDLVFIK